MHARRPHGHPRIGQRRSHGAASFLALALASVVSITACAGDVGEPDEPVASVLSWSPSPSGASTGDDFWVPPHPLPAGEPGDVIRARSIETPAGEATLALHLSSDVRGDPVAVSSVVYLPDEVNASTPVLAVAHGTTGIADECAPSRLALGGIGGDLDLAPDLLDQGWVVVVTDYQGLGTPGRHPYLVTRAAAQNVLDSVRAIERLELTDGSSPVVVFGFSQGGGAAAYIADIAGTYAPELDLRGVVAAAPATELSDFGSADLTPNRIAFGMMIVAGYLAAYPELDARAYLSADGQAGVDSVEQGCLDEVLQGLVDADTQGWSSPPDSPGREEWQRVLDENTPGRRASDVPVIVVHGRDDTTVLATSSEAYQRRACLAGADVGRVVYPGVGHVDMLTGTDAVERSIGWFESWLSGRSAGPGCS